MSEYHTTNDLKRLLWEARDLLIAAGMSQVPHVGKKQRQWVESVNIVLKGFDPLRAFPPKETLKACLSHMTEAESSQLAELATEIVNRAHREFEQYKAERK